MWCPLRGQLGAMGCGSGKGQVEASSGGCPDVVRWLVAFSRTQRHNDDGQLKKKAQDRSYPWFSGSNKRPQQQELTDQLETGKPATYKDKFDGRVTARYDIKALIGRGSFSRVVRAEHRATRQPFAIKMLRLEAEGAGAGAGAGAGSGGRDAAARELAVLRRVRHANVIRLVEVFQLRRRVYMVLELATGGQLLERIASRGRFTERDASRALSMALGGAAYLHSLGIAHRDLKPENLLYYHPGPDARLLLTDFGRAAFCGADSGSDAAHTQAHMTKSQAEETWSLRSRCGTPEYLAPELVLRRPSSCAVDMWALGVVSYMVLSGSMPFEDESRTRLYAAILRGKYSFHGDPWPSVSNLAKDFIQRLLASEPAGRLSAEQALRHPWVVTMAAASSSRNLHPSISQNLKRRASRSSERCPSGGAKSAGGGKEHLD